MKTVSEEPAAWLIEVTPQAKKEHFKTRVLRAERGDPTKKEFWVNGKVEKGHKIYPLYKGDRITKLRD